jgi:hypothetical protein
MTDMESPKSKLSKAKIKIAKKNLRKLQRDNNYSLRQIAKILKNKITFQSLGRFINEKDYVPKSEEVCKLLDLYADPNPYRGLPKWYKRTPEALDYFNTKRAQIKQMSDEAKRQRDTFAKGKL